MKIHLWRNQSIDQWRWTLSSEKFPHIMESGNSSKLEQAMGDIQNTIEWLLSKNIIDHEETTDHAHCSIAGAYNAIDGGTD